jgi:uroporphyrinogen decarboxylase
MGNVPPLGVLAKGSPEEVYEAARKCIQAHGMGHGMILSAGGGVSPGTPKENIKALISAVRR